MKILIGTQLFGASGDAGVRQQRAAHALCALEGVEIVNLQFAVDDSPFVHEGIETVRALHDDSHRATGVMGGARKPIIPEICEVLAREATRRGCMYFCFANSDITFTQAAVEAIALGERDGYAFSRMDVDPVTDADIRMVIEGIDAYAMRVEWWRENTFRFPRFIAGEPFWDSHCAATLVRHGDGVILNTRPLIRHVAHERLWDQNSPLARYNGYLSELESRLFSRWCEYHAHRSALATSDITDDDHLALQRRIFRRETTLANRLMDHGRAARAWVAHTVRGVVR